MPAGPGGLALGNTASARKSAACEEQRKCKTCQLRSVRAGRGRQTAPTWMGRRLAFGRPSALGRNRTSLIADVRIGLRVPDPCVVHARVVRLGHCVGREVCLDIEARQAHRVGSLPVSSPIPDVQCEAWGVRRGFLWNQHGHGCSSTLPQAHEAEQVDFASIGARALPRPREQPRCIAVHSQPCCVSKAREPAANHWQLDVGKERRDVTHILAACAA